MTEPTPTTFKGKLRAQDGLRIGIVLSAAIVLLVGAAVATGASPSPSGQAGASADPGASSAPDGPPGEKERDGWLRRGFGHGFGGFGRGFGFHGFGNISVTAISGADVSLETANGWSRTISVTDDVTITKGGQEIALADLAVGDRVALREDRAEDGTYTVTDIVVILPTAFGEVTAKTADTITVSRRDGTTTTIHVDGDTTYRVAGDADASLADITVGMLVVARGSERGDGSLDAVAVRAGTINRGLRMDDFPGPPGEWGPDAPDAPEASPADGAVG
jgi:hypothetical protein